jgi:hypothetical protein
MTLLICFVLCALHAVLVSSAAVPMRIGRHTYVIHASTAAGLVFSDLAMILHTELLPSLHACARGGCDAIDVRQKVGQL